MNQLLQQAQETVAAACSRHCSTEAAEADVKASLERMGFHVSDCRFNALTGYIECTVGVLPHRMAVPV